MGAESLFVEFPGVPVPIQLSVGLSGSTWSATHAYADPNRAVMDNSVYINRVFRSLRQEAPYHATLIRYGSNPHLVNPGTFSENDLKQGFEDFYQGILRNCLFAELCRPRGNDSVELYRGARTNGRQIITDGIIPTVLPKPQGKGTISREWRAALDAEEGTLHDPVDPNKIDDRVLLWNLSSSREQWLWSYVTPDVRKPRRGTLFTRKVAPANP